MAKIEIYENFTIGGQNFFAGTLEEENALGGMAKGLRKKEMIGPVTKATKDRLKAEAAAQEKLGPDRSRANHQVAPPEAVSGNEGTGSGNDETGGEGGDSGPADTNEPTATGDETGGEGGKE